MMFLDNERPMHKKLAGLLNKLDLFNFFLANEHQKLACRGNFLYATCRQRMELLLDNMLQDLTNKLK